MQDIAAAAGVPKGSFYNYFESKDVYAADVLDRYWCSIHQTYGPILGDSSLPPLEAIGNFFAGLIDYHAERRFVPGCLIGNLALELAATNGMAREKLRRLFLDWAAGIKVRLNEAIRSGVLPLDANTDAMAEALIDAFEGAVLRAKVDQDRAALRRFADFVLPRLLS